MLAALLLTVVVACDAGPAARATPAPTPQPPPDQPATHAAPRRPAPPELPGPDRSVDVSRLRFAGTERTQDWLLKQLQTATAVGFKPVGSTSTVFRTTLVGPINGAFKASTRERPRGPVSEIAAYRVARCLGMSNVPPAVSRQFRASKLRAALHPDDKAKWPEIRDRIGVEEDGVVRGTMIYWITDLTELDIDEPEGIRRWSRWLAQDGELPADRRPLAASVSTMIAFDYLIGNFDRWSGGNARGNPTATQVYARDNDIAFPPALSEKRHGKLIARLLRVERFSRSFYARLRGLSPACVELELSRDPAGAPERILRPGRMGALFDRRDTLISHIDALAREHGIDPVLAFP